MRRTISTVVLASAAPAVGVGASGPAEAKGCLKGAAVGGVAGHVAGHHAVLGAAAGCAIEHHREAVRDRADRTNQSRVPSTPPDRAEPSRYDTNRRDQTPNRDLSDLGPK